LGSSASVWTMCVWTFSVFTDLHICINIISASTSHYQPHNPFIQAAQLGKSQSEFGFTHIWTDWLSSGFASHSTEDRSFRRHSSQPISWLSTKKLHQINLNNAKTKQFKLTQDTKIQIRPMQKHTKTNLNLTNQPPYYSHYTSQPTIAGISS